MIHNKLTMQADDFYQSRQNDWKRLSTLVERSQSSLQRLTPEEIKELGQLYRSVTSDLALAQRDFPQHRVTTFLNQLVGRTHAVIYRDKPLARNRLLQFIRTGFPQAFRQIWPFFVTAAALFIIPVLLAAVSTFWEPKAANWLLPAAVQELVPDIEDQKLWTNIPISERPYASTFIMSNNIQVAFLAFAGGVLAGIPTVWILIMNGLLMGGLTGLTVHYGVGFELWSFIIAHGVIELSVIFIAGAAGLTLGWAILRPGLRRRRDALLVAARQSVYLLLGCVPLLVIAGLIEGFISPAETIPWLVKWSIGIGSGICLYSYLLLAGRTSRRGSETGLPLQLQIAVDDGNR